MVSQPMVCGPFFGLVDGASVCGHYHRRHRAAVVDGSEPDRRRNSLMTRRRRRSLGVYWATLPPHGALSQIVLGLVYRGAVRFSFSAGWINWPRRAEYSAHRASSIDLPDERFASGFGLGHFGRHHLVLGRVTSLIYALIFAMWAGQMAWNHIAYAPRLTPIRSRVDHGGLAFARRGHGVNVRTVPCPMIPKAAGRRWRANKPAEEGRRPVMIFFVGNRNLYSIFFPAGALEF